MAFLSQTSPSIELPWWPNGKEPTSHVGDLRGMGSTPGLGRSPGGGHGNPLQYSCLENPMDRGAWRATVRRVSDSDTTDPHSIAEAQRSTGSLLVCSGLWSCLTTELNLLFRISESELFPLTRKTYKFKDTLNWRGGGPEWMVNYDKWHSIKILE